MSEIQRRALDALRKLPDGLQEKALIRLEATADAVEQDNTKPITSAAVFVEVGNIEALLAAL